ncbi:MAG: hypothetical protein JST83_16520 [Bacteroidetes bacterium]|nr:hypothetical protein [Bacteroidota bacterium]
MNEDEPLRTWEDDRSFVAAFLLIPVALVSAYYITFGVILSTDRYFQVNPFLVYFCIFWPVYWSYVIWRTIRDQPTTLYRDRVEIRRRSGELIGTYYLRDMTGWDVTYRRGNKEGVYIVFPGWSVSFGDGDDELEHLFDAKRYPRVPASYKLKWLGLFLLLIPLILGTLYGLTQTWYGLTWLRDHDKGATTHHLRILAKIPPAAEEQPVSAQGLEEFVWTGDGARRLKEVSRDSIESGDSVAIDILQYDYDIKIAHTRPSTWWDRHIDWREIPVIRAYYPHGEAIPAYADK